MTGFRVPARRNGKHLVRVTPAPQGKRAHQGISGLAPLQDQGDAERIAGFDRNSDEGSKRAVLLELEMERLPLPLAAYQFGACVGPHPDPAEGPLGEG
jgi:hypothetical protein